MCVHVWVCMPIVLQLCALRRDSHLQSACGHLSFTRLWLHFLLSLSLFLSTHPLAKTWALDGCQTRDRNICLPERRLREVGCCSFSLGSDSLWGLEGVPSSSLSFLCTPRLCSALHGCSTFPLLSDSCVTSDTDHFSISPKEHFISSSICFPSPLLIFMAKQQKPPHTTVIEHVELR